MKASDFIRGMAIGMAAGAAVDMLRTGGSTKKCKTKAGRAMQKMGCAVDNVAHEITDMWR